VNARELALRNGEHAERIGVAQVLLGRERKFRQVGQRFQVVGVDACFVEALAEEG
jgi:hypothetical protein